MNGLTSLTEGVGIALDSLRASKVRAALTILGVAIGVMVVMVIAAMINGINQEVTSMLESTGPRTFFVFRFFRDGPQVSDGSEERQPWRRMPPLTVTEASGIAELPSISFVAYGDRTSAPVEYQAQKLGAIEVDGFSFEWPKVAGGDVTPGRSFTFLEEASTAEVVVLSQKIA